ncbi:UDP-N-acetylmuramate dehydrogenase [Fluviicoccus keumensis]|uniref:UDP-N-acetylenolpyruvoylglucosamine reductase n=1 Tax=Fluviicoccus keumensis TaxID=1435465 RepID=A0A4Q7Z3S6_9GAMM|nr:UDP-N-acetylmuramate dehydrogenase [Fluviicoccus keumensis]RZU45032.1 UDP-N-acetylmuramate dehydrogenase [Fluviicoccus keumensis]
MMLENQLLTRFNTFGLPARARFLALVDSDQELRRLLLSVTARNLPVLVLGGGSNLVLAADFPGLVLVLRQRGVRVVSSTPAEVVVEAAAGECWHDFVQHTLAQGWYGLENLSLIPGTVGAAPVQNIGAYGVEIKDRFAGLTAIDRETGEYRDFNLADCRFGYRDSFFKQQGKDHWVITRVRFRLDRMSQPQLAYGDIQRQLAHMGIIHPSPVDVAQAVMAIRRSKLPDPAVIGNAGSFFKNPVVTAEKAAWLKSQWPDLVAYAQPVGVKLAAGWLIDQCGWKGKSLGAAGVYEKQALVLVNRGGAKGQDILALAEAIRHSVEERFDVRLEMEPVVVR